jgi:hypothetical protein
MVNLDTDPFPVGMVEIKHKKVLVCTDQTEMTKGKNVVISDDHRNCLIKPHNPEIGVWKENVQRKLARRVKPTSAMVIEKYQRQLEEDWRYRVTRGIKRDRFFEARNKSDLQAMLQGGEPRRRTVQHSTDWEPRIRQNPWFTIRSGLGNPDHRVNHTDVLATEKNHHEGQNKPRSTS